MSSALFYLQIGQREEISFGNPFSGKVDGFQCYDLDNHADAVTMQYAHRLLAASAEVVLVLRQHSAGNSLGPLSGFLDQALRRKNEVVRAYTIGKIDLPLAFVKRMGLVETTGEGVIDLLFSERSGDITWKDGC